MKIFKIYIIFIGTLAAFSVCETQTSLYSKDNLGADVSVPFIVHDNRILLDVKVNGKGPYTFNLVQLLAIKSGISFRDLIRTELFVTKKFHIICFKKFALRFIHLASVAQKKLILDQQIQSASISPILFSLKNQSKEALPARTKNNLSIFLTVTLIA